MAPIQASLSGGSSAAENKTTLGNVSGEGGAGIRAPIVNLSMGGSKLAASQGSGLDTTTIAIGAAVAVGIYFLARRSR